MGARLASRAINGLFVLFPAALGYLVFGRRVLESIRPIAAAAGPDNLRLYR
jgi:hypothetical protein